ncbi:MAG: hypothetical protein AB7G54_00565 [Methyloceanibacter sp.]
MSFSSSVLRDLLPLRADPGDAGALPVYGGQVPLVSAGAETRTLAAPSRVGARLVLAMKTDGGNIVVTCATTVNQAGNNTLTFADVGDSIELLAVNQDATLRWKVVGNEGVALSTV